MLGLKSLPVNHPMHRAYRITVAIVGLLLLAFGVAGFVVSGDVLNAPASTPFSAVCVVAGLVFLAAAVLDGNIAAEINTYGGALLIVLGMVCLLTMHSASSNFLDVSMADVIILFVAGMLGLAGGFYGRVGPAEH
jgi:hypothetical protein